MKIDDEEFKIRELLHKARVCAMKRRGFVEMLINQAENRAMKIKLNISEEVEEIRRIYNRE